MIDPVILAKIEAETDKANERWVRDERRRTMYQFSAPHILLLEEKIAKMRAAWYSGEAPMSDFVKMAAIAIRALTEINHNDDY